MLKVVVFSAMILCVLAQDHTTEMKCLNENAVATRYTDIEV